MPPKSQCNVVLHPLPSNKLHPEPGLMPCQHYVVELRQPAVVVLQTTGADLRGFLLKEKILVMFFGVQFNSSVSMMQSVSKSQNI